MSFFTSLGIFIFSASIIVSLKAIPGIFAIFHHYASGKYSARKVSDLSIFFIIGAETLPATIFVILNYVLSVLGLMHLNPISGFLLPPLTGMLFALALVFLLFYFRKGHGTKLFISRNTAKTIEERAQKTKTRSDAFVLGFVSGIPELIFTLPLYLMVLIDVSENFIDPIICAPILLAFILITIAPLFVIYAYFKNGNNLANFARFRTRNKNFFRFFIPVLYISLGTLLIIFEAFL